MSKVISMVPSWTETLIECGVEVVGRTRFCIHPDEKVKSIKIVGGTKDIQWDKVKSLNADFLLLDKDENIKEWQSLSPIKTIVTHVENIQNLISDLHKLSKQLSNPQLLRLADLWQSLPEVPGTPIEKIPGFIKWIRKEKTKYSKFVYIIWKDPWISASGNTFIGSLFSLYGISISVIGNSEKYPKWEDLNFSDDTLLLFSTEPFPFHKKLKELTQLGFDSALIDGEAFSWFGIRSYRFLTRNL